jgi:hypothetical protein
MDITSLYESEVSSSNLDVGTFYASVVFNGLAQQTFNLHSLSSNLSGGIVSDGVPTHTWLPSFKEYDADKTRFVSLLGKASDS